MRFFSASSSAFCACASSKAAFSCLAAISMRLAVNSSLPPLITFNSAISASVCCASSAFLFSLSAMEFSKFCCSFSLARTSRCKRSISPSSWCMRSAIMVVLAVVASLSTRASCSCLRMLSSSLLSACIFFCKASRWLLLSVSSFSISASCGRSSCNLPRAAKYSSVAAERSSKSTSKFLLMRCFSASARLKPEVISARLTAYFCSSAFKAFSLVL